MSSNREIQRIQAKYQELGGKPVFGDPVGPPKDLTRIIPQEPKPSGTDPQGHPVRDLDPVKTEVIGVMQNYEHGAILANVLGGCYGIHGSIWRKWHQVGGWGSFLGSPVSDIHPTAVEGGSYAHFAQGTVALMPGGHEAFEVHGAILDKWDALGDTTGILGFPLTDETKTADRVGHFNHFSGPIKGLPQSSSSPPSKKDGAVVTQSSTGSMGIGQSPRPTVLLQEASVFWKPNLGAHEVHGVIRSYWAGFKFELNKDLGYPISDVLRVPGSADRYCDFENGVVYWREGDPRAGSVSTPSFTASGVTIPMVAADVLTQIQGIVTPIIQSFPLPSPANSLEIRRGPSFRGPINEMDPGVSSPVTDYSVDRSGAIHNREYRLTVGFHIGIDGPLGDVDVDLDFNLEIYFDRARDGAGAIMARLGDYTYRTKMGSIGTDSMVSLIDSCVLEPALNHLIRNPRTVMELPASLTKDNVLLSLKVLPDGSLAAFAVHPRDPG